LLGGLEEFPSNSDGLGSSMPSLHGVELLLLALLSSSSGSSVLSSLPASLDLRLLSRENDFLARLVCASGDL